MANLAEDWWSEIGLEQIRESESVIEKLDQTEIATIAWAVPLFILCGRPAERVVLSIHRVTDRIVDRVAKEPVSLENRASAGDWHVRLSAMKESLSRVPARYERARETIASAVATDLERCVDAIQRSTMAIVRSQPPTRLVLKPKSD